MKKINALLHDVTVINFLLVAKLTVRYKWASLAAVSVIALSIAYLHFTQITIHTKKVFFKVYDQQDSTRGAKKLSDLMGDMASSLISQGEISAIVTNFDFTYALAERIVNSPHFPKFDFNNPLKKGYQSQAEIFAECSDKECNIKTVQAIIPSLYSIDSEVSSGRFILSVTSRSALTTLEIIKNFKEALEENRYKTALADLDKQIASSQELIDASRADIEAKGGFTRIASGESIESLISQQRAKVNNLASRITAESEQLHFQKIRLKESEQSASKDINGENKLEYEKYVKLTKKIEDLRQNIASINAIPDSSRTETETLVLNQLKKELTINESHLRKMGKVNRNIAYDDKFINTQMGNQNNFEFDYKVVTEKVKKLQKEHAEAQKELEGLFAQKAEVENGLLNLKPDLEYLKELESKMVSLRMLKASVKSDVAFEQFGSEVKSFKRNSFLQLVIFSFVLVSFLLFVALIIIYIFDDRVHDEYEIKKCCDNLQVIGTAPSFE